MPKDEPSWLSISCACCGHRWYGIDRGHCTACHRTFADTDLFDRHRVDHGCTNPVELGMIKNPKTGIWELRATRATRRPG